MDVRMPDGTVITNVPDNTTQADLLARYEQHRADSTPKIKIGQEGFSDALSGVIDNTGVIGKNLASAGTALSNLWEGAKQIAGRGDDQAIQANRQIASAAPVGAFAGNAALLAPTMMIPGANTIAGAGLVGATQAFFTPTQESESRLANTAMGGALGAAGQYGGNKLGEFLTKRLAAKTAEGAAAASQNSVRDATLKAAQEAGYTVPASTVNPSWINKRLESIAGKAAVGQEAASRNQEITNALARKALGLADDAPLTEGTLAQFRNAAAQPYRDVSALPTMPPDRLTGIGGYPLIGPPKQAPADALRDLQLVRSQANDAWKEYGRTGVVTAKERAIELSQKSNALESYLEDTAKTAGNDSLVSALRSARTQIAKSFDVEKGLNIGTGNISAPILGRAMDKGAPLTGELQTIAKFAEAFPALAREAEKIPTPGVSKSEALAAALLGTGGAVAGGPVGAIAGALPLLSGPVRTMLLSKPYQALMAQPQYGPSLITKAAGQLTPDRAALLARALAAQ